MRRKLITKAHLRYAFKTIEWFYYGTREVYTKAHDPIPNDYVTCFYMDLGGNIYRQIVKDYHIEKEKALRENSSV